MILICASRQNLKRNNNEMQQLERKIEQISKENDKSTKKIRAYIRLPQVMQQKSWQEQRSTKRDELKEIYPQYVKIVLNYIRSELYQILKCQAAEVPEEKADTRETYKVYGLLLSACALKKRDPVEPAVVNQVVKDTQKTYKRSETLIIQEYVVKAITLTHNMLTLVPPLLITTEIKKYNEALHDVNRATWNDDRRKERLIYYRPILLDGNQLHIAEKGLVGNKIEEESKKQQHQQKLQLELQKESVIQEHRQIEKQHQQSQEAIKCAACKGVLHNGDEGGTLDCMYHIGLFWHKQHYKCFLCDKKVVYGNFKYFEDNNVVYCNGCASHSDKVMNDTQRITDKCTSV
ncbi:PREDICTED: uncharacterized protein LOC109589134 isoform X1 [Amphimedon queenslandica]|uniref:LIM zinc-binding domain-containing protein n=1 Tax=Amphimedon queenslandica TaxID=400682 RepID=A0AAN0JV73_AMPQE|nr:PREDICTED: uncharacterized protein LOC109589134 isoform X1 [Amphimedon queenslandica]|eukprot:XP_019860808.1 PREDICTED: uncharacterized protein LOC109589134 isoform X1 [Amphimedon queenslandica]